MFIFSLLKHYKREITDLIDYFPCNKVKYISSVEQPSRIYLYIRKIFGVEKVILDTSFPGSQTSLIFIEVFNRSNLSAFISEKAQSPHIPCVVVVESSSEMDIDHLYEHGADYVIDKGYINSQETLKEFFMTLRSLILKNYIYEFYWNNFECISQTTFERIYLPYADAKDIPEVFRSIKAIFNNTFGHLRKPHTLFEMKYDKNLGSFVYLSLWSVLNEIMLMIINEFGYKHNEGTHPKNFYLFTKNNRSFFYTSGKKEYSDKQIELINSYHPESQRIKYSKKGNKGFCYFPPQNIRNEVNFSRDENVNQTEIWRNKPSKEFHPKDIIPLMLYSMLGLDNDSQKEDLLAEFHKFNLLRNELHLIHGNLSRKDEYYDSYIKLCCIRLFNLIYFMLTGEFIEENKINFIFFIQRNYLGNNMRIRGIFKNSGNPENFLINYKDEIIKKNKSALICLDRNYPDYQKQKMVLNNLKDGDKIEIIFTIDYNEGSNYQFLHLVDILKL